MIEYSLKLTNKSEEFMVSMINALEEEIDALLEEIASLKQKSDKK